MEKKLMHGFSDLQVKKIILFAMEAGEVAVKFFKARDFKTYKKSDGSKVTSADIAVSKLLYERFSKEFPQIPLICEEGDLRNVSNEDFFLIDPIDGTSSFVSASDQFSINISLIKEKKSVFGLIYAPLFEGGKLIFCNEQGQVISKKLGKKEKVLVPEVTHINNLRIVTSFRSKDIDIDNYISQFYPKFIKNFSVERLSSAIKFFRILESMADIYLHFRPSMEWDSAAGQGLIELMGGKVKNLSFNSQGVKQKIISSKSLIYRKPNFKNQPFMAKL